ncbi:hypothetical protein HRbin22_00788 [Candidatus Thermoflexus japonica]|uniref:Right handed beta helix domain-containing protein n=1 Tax=Candidatus Thermoflexus japonica TaxID=2035417 RepID=A0A2H5Y5E5_9CHLR|nr:hypothetical protein HRbin22_00788 [Candidatus Thermoflexus japonica]
MRPIPRLLAVLALALGVVLALLVGLGGLSPAAADPGSTLFAKPDGTGTACTQASPCALQTALSRAGDGDTIYAAAGTYTGTGSAVITITKSITLYGGWDGAASGPVVRDPALYPTVLDGEWARRVVSITGPATVTLEGLTIARGKVVSTTAPTQGTRWDGAGLYARDATLTLRHTRFYSNVVDVSDVSNSWAYGGGAAVEGGHLVVEASTFRWNSAWARQSSLGGGLSISGTLTAAVTGVLFQDNDAWHASGLYFGGAPGPLASFTLRDSTFVDNGRNYSVGRAWGGYAGALKVFQARATIEGNTFMRNIAGNDYGAVWVFLSDLQFSRNFLLSNECGGVSALYLYEVSPFTVTNNIIAGNKSTSIWQYPAALVRKSDGRFLHNTIARNRSTYGVQVDGGANLVLTNTILVSHTVGITVAAGSTATLEATLWGSGPWANGTDWGGNGTVVTGTVNIWGDPAFVDPAGGNYHIGPGSAAINAGVNAGVATDIDGDPRPIGAGYDIGADEYIARIYLPLVLRNY